MEKSRFRLACFGLLVWLAGGGPAIAAGLIRAPAVPQPHAPGDLAGLVLENTLTHELAPRYVTFGQVFARGQLRSGAGVAARIGGRDERAQIDVKNRYKDGSVLFGIVTLRSPPIGAGADAAVMLREGPASAGAPVAILPALRAHDFTIMLALRAAGVATRYVTIDAARWFARDQAAGVVSPWLSGSVVSGVRIERHIGGSLRLVMDVRAYASGGIEADIQFDNDIAMGKTGGTVTYGVTISQGGKPVFAAPSIHQFQYQDWHTIVRSGGRAPINVVHDVAAMERIGIVPAYDLKGGIPRPMLVGELRQIGAPGWDAPLATDGVTQYMPMVGGRGDIGPTSQANAIWLMTQNPVAAEYAMGQADAAGAVPWHFFYRKTNAFLTTDDIPDIWVDGRGGPYSGTIGLTQKVSGKTGWAADVAHEPDLSFIPYLLTGRRYFLDQLDAEADYSEVDQWPAAQARNQGAGTIVGPGEQVRGAAWSLREVADAAYIDPDGSPMRTYFQHMIANNMAYLRRSIPAWTRQEGEGYGYIIGTYGTPGMMPPWQQDYFATTMATMARQRVPGAAQVLHWEDHFLAGSVLSKGNGFNPRNGIAYNLMVFDPKTKAPYRTWAAIQAATRKAGQDNGDGWTHSRGDYGNTRLAALASLYDATGSPSALRAYEWVKHSGAPFVDVAGIQTTPQFWVVPLTRHGR